MPEGAALGGSWSEAAGAVTASSIGTTVTANASANTKGTAVELIAATAHDTHWVSVTAVTGGTTGNNGLLDILIGASTEAVLIPNLPVISRAANEGGGGPFLFPLFIPKGSRLAAQYQNQTGSSTVEVVVHLFGGNPSGPWADCTYVDRYGATATSLGTNVDPGGTAHTYLANYVEITASTLRPIRWLLLCAQNDDAAFTGNQRWTIRLGIGAATEAQIGGDLIVSAGNTLDNALFSPVFPIPLFISTGSRLSVNAKCSVTVDGDRDLYVSLFGCG